MPWSSLRDVFESLNVLWKEAATNDFVKSSCQFRELERAAAVAGGGGNGLKKVYLSESRYLRCNRRLSQAFASRLEVSAGGRDVGG